MDNNNVVDGHGKKSILGNTAVKIVLFLCMLISFAVTTGAALTAYYIDDNDGYHTSESEFRRQFMREQIWQCYYYIREQDINLAYMERIENIEGGDDIALRLVREDDGKQIWSDYDGFTTPYIYRISIAYSSDTVNWGEGVLKQGQFSGNDVVLQTYEWEFYINPDFPDESIYFELCNRASMLYGIRYSVIAVLAACGFIFALCFILLMCSAGHHNGKEGISPSLLNFVPIDLYAVIWAVAAFFGMLLILYNSPTFIWYIFVMLILAGVLEIAWTAAFAMELMTRLKLGKPYRNSVIYRLMVLIAKGVRLIWREILPTMSGIPLIINNLAAFLAVCVLEFMVILIFCEAEIFVLWLIEKLILLLVILYFSRCQALLGEAGRALAGGNLNYKLDTSKMLFYQKEHGENLNSIALGINAAVDERMKSERLKTELITNVTHDIKTPLTSIINYSSLIVGETTDNERINEYAEVLGRQSMRLKKLLDDLLEVSKAATGNLEVKLQPCDVGVMLTQTIGEYEHKFEEKGLKLVIKQPETQIKLMADSGHMWRVFDNLMNNICKYAMENSRVYLTVECSEDKVYIVFKNMSKYEMDISSEELTERFIRGDKSRHIEGNGLGLSIAESLVALQNGNMKILTDGDLFKVILSFPVIAQQ